MTTRDDKGQVGLVVLLIAAVVLTVGISVASRSVSEVRLTAEEEESTRALNVAEAGIEDILSGTLPDSYMTNTLNFSGGDVDIEVTPEQTLTDIVVFPGQVIEFDATGADSAENLQIGWSGGNPAFVVTVINDSGMEMSRYAVDPKAVIRSNGFSVDDPMTVAPISGTSFSVPMVGSARLARIKVLYEASELTVTPSWSAEVQYHTVRAQAQNVGDSNRSVQVTRTAPQLPSIFDYVLFSGTSL